MEYWNFQHMRFRAYLVMEYWNSQHMRALARTWKILQHMPVLTVPGMQHRLALKDDRMTKCRMTSGWRDDRMTLCRMTGMTGWPHVGWPWDDRMTRWPYVGWPDDGMTTCRMTCSKFGMTCLFLGWPVRLSQTPGCLFRAWSPILLDNPWSKWINGTSINPFFAQLWKAISPGSEGVGRPGF